MDPKVSVTRNNQKHQVSGTIGSKMNCLTKDNKSKDLFCFKSTINCFFKLAGTINNLNPEVSETRG